MSSPAPASRPSWWRRFLGPEADTEPVPVVERLRLTPYRDPRQMPAPDAEDVRERLELVLRLAAALLRCGTGTDEVESSAVATALALGLDGDALDLDVTLTSLLAGYAPSGSPPVTLVRVVRAPGRDYARMAALHRLVTDLVAGGAGPRDVGRRLDAIARQRRPYARWLVTAAWGALAASVVVRFGGDALAAGVAFAVTVAVDRIGRGLGRLSLPAFYVTLVGAVLSTAFAAAGLAAVDALPGVSEPASSAGLVVAASIVLLLPGAALVALVQDAIRGFPVTATGRLLEALLQVAAIIAGVVLVLEVAARLGVPVPVAQVASGSLRDVTVQLGAATAAGGLAALASRAPPGLLPRAALTAGAGFVVFVGASALDLPQPVATAAAAFVIGVVGRVAALRAGAPPLVVVAPATTPLLPGLVIFESLRLFTAGEDVAGLLTLLQAGIAAVAIGGGVVLGDGAARPVEQGLERFAQRSRRRRR